jgi:hypothetical protein
MRRSWNVPATRNFGRQCRLPCQLLPVDVSLQLAELREAVAQRHNTVNAVLLSFTLISGLSAAFGGCGLGSLQARLPGMRP